MNVVIINNSGEVINVLVCSEAYAAKLIARNKKKNIVTDPTGTIKKGDTYDKQAKKFTPKKPFKDWILVNNVWVAPSSPPNDGKVYIWDDKKGKWKDVTKLTKK